MGYLSGRSRQAHRPIRRPRLHCRFPSETGGDVLARAALAAVLAPLAVVCWMSFGEIRRIR